MRRLGLLLVLGGTLAAGAGLLAWRAARKALRPATVDLHRIGSARGYLQLERHVRLFPLVVYASAGRPGDPAAPLHHAYYPVVAEGDPYLDELQALRARHGSAQQVPREKLFGGTPPFALLVRTRRFARLADIPSRAIRSASLAGMTLDPRELLAPELEQLRRSYPRTDLQRVVLLAENEAPPDTTARALALAGAGAALVLLGGGLWLGGGR